MILLKRTKKTTEEYFLNNVKRSVAQRCHIIAIFVEKISRTFLIIVYRFCYRKLTRVRKLMEISFNQYKIYFDPCKLL